MGANRIKGNNVVKKNIYVFTASASTAQTLSSAWDKIEMDNEIYDPNGNYDPTTNFRYTAPITGYYIIGATVQLQNAGGTGRIICSIWKGGAEVYRGSDTESGEGGTVTGLVQLDAGEYVEAYSYLDVTATLEPTTCRFFGMLVSI